MVKLRIKAICKEKGITQAQLAQRLGILPVSFSQAVSRNKFDIDYLERIANALGVPVPSLFEGGGTFVTCPNCGCQLFIDVKKKNEEQRRAGG